MTRHGVFTGLRWSIRDISERVRQEDQLRDLNAELEGRVAERTEALEVANRSKDEFLATLSHELRTPLNVVLGLIFRLRSGSLSAPQHVRAVETIDRNARELSRLVEDLLDTARITNGRLKLTLQLLELAPIVRSAIDSAEPTAEARGVRLVTNLRAGIVLKCDAERLRQVAWNLLVNALKFTSEGGTITVNVGGENGRAFIEVRDTGAGIDPDVLPRIFERFWQGEQSMTRLPTGLGVGLAIVKHVVEMHGGNVEAFSEGQGRGAAFIVQLPAADHASRATRAESASL